MRHPDDVFDRVRRSNPVDESRLAPRQAASAVGLRTRPHPLRNPWRGRVAGVATVAATFLVIGGLLVFAVPRGDAPDAGRDGAPGDPLAPPVTSTAGSSTVDRETLPPPAETVPEISVPDVLSTTDDGIGNPHPPTPPIASTSPTPLPSPVTAAPAPSPATPSVSDAAAILARFSVLRRPQTAADRPTEQVLAATRDADPAGVRRARASDPALYVAPGAKEICLVAQPGGFACAPLANAVPGPMVLSSPCVRNQPGFVEILGLVPDEVRTVEVRTSSGDLIPVTVTDNVFVARVPASPVPDTLILTLDSGRTVASGSGISPDIAQEGC